eukprot:127646-Rhodomonas_salina.2
MVALMTLSAEATSDVGLVRALNDNAILPCITPTCKPYHAISASVTAHQALEALAALKETSGRRIRSL